MKKWILIIVTLFTLSVLSLTTSAENLQNAVKSDLIIFKTKKKLANGLPDGETPASLACVYGLTAQVPGCNKNIATQPPSGGWGAIALVGAYYVANAEPDLQVFINQFKLAPCSSANGCFNQYYATAPNGCNQTNPPPIPPIAKPATQVWWTEQVLDIEMAHAMAPDAKIFLVEAASDHPDDLLAAENCASSLVAPTGGVISNSWSGPETPEDVGHNSYFTTPGIVYLASSGDFGAPARYPSSSPNVVSAGGTTIKRDGNGNLIGEEAWSREPGTPPGEKSGSSGGPSQYQSRPSFQNIVQKIVGSRRGTPDIAFDANPRSGVLIYSSHDNAGWLVVGGTSVASPALAGILNAANHRASSSNAELSYIYSFYPKRYHQYWHDITSGNNGFSAMAGYDFVTGLGSPRTYAGK